MSRKLPEWRFQVAKKVDILEEFSVPGRRLSEESVKNFLRAVFVRRITKSVEEMVLFHLNQRHGEPRPLNFPTITSTYHVERSEIGYWWGDWDFRVTAVCSVPKQTVEALARFVERNRASVS